MPEQPLSVALVQTAMVWQSPAANRNKIAALLAGLEHPVDLVVLPEMFTAGFGGDPAIHAEPDDGPTLAWMAGQAALLDAAICGSYAVATNAGVVNRLQWVTPSGKAGHYDKRHLFRMAGEHRRYIAGSERPVFVWRSWRVLPQICYDLRFPVWQRNRGDYDLMVVPANWPSARAGHWRLLAQARAVENLACVAAVNRVGVDGNGLDYAGDSLLIDGRGERLVDMQSRDGVAVGTLCHRVLNDYRREFAADLDADQFVLGDS